MLKLQYFGHLTHWKRPWCWKWLKAGGEGDDRAWDGWMASRTQWTWVWANSGSWWRTGKPDALQSMGSQRVGYDWVTELNWTIHICNSKWTKFKYNSYKVVGKDWRQEKERQDKMVGWHHQLHGHEFEQVQGAGEGQGNSMLQSMGSERVGHDWATEQQQHEIIGWIM